MPVDIGPRIGIDGEKEFRQQLQNICNQSGHWDFDYDYAGRLQRAGFLAGQWTFGGERKWLIRILERSV